MWSAADASSSRLFADDPRAASRLGTDNAWRTHHGPRRVSDNLPPGWKLTQLQDLAASEPRAITDGPFGSNLKTAHYTSDGPRVVRLQNIGDGVFRRGDAHISQEHYEALIQHAVQAGDLVVASLGEVLPRACLVPDWIPPAIVKADCIRVRLHSDVNPAYVSFALQLPRLRRETAAEIKGVGRPRLGLLRIKQLPIPLAPRAEQDRIVAAIEEHFSHLDAVESTLKRELRSIAALRWSLLTDAFKVDGTLPRNWQRKEIGEVAEVQLGRQRSPQHHAGPQMRPYLRAANVTWTGLNLDDVKQMNFDEDDFETYRLHPGDLLLNEASGSPNEVGKPAVWWGEIEDCCFQNTLLRLRARDVDPDYLYWYCYMAALTGRFGEAGRGVNIRHLGKRGLARFPIAVAPPSEQKDIVTRLQEQFQQSSECETSVRQAQERARALRCSILAKAFNGQLVPQDPDDGPADVLLRRLSREKSTRSKRERAAA